MTQQQPHSQHRNTQQDEKNRNRMALLLPITKSPTYRFIHLVISQFKRNLCREKAASLTYTTMLSLIPMLTVIIIILSSIPQLQATKDSVLHSIYSNLLPQTSFKLSSYLNDFAEKSTNLTVIGVLFLFVTTMMMLSKIEEAFNRIWNVESTRYGMLGFMRYWTLISLGSIVLGLVFVMSSTVSSLSFLNQQVAGYTVDWRMWMRILSTLVTLGGFTVIYWFVPNTRVPVKSALLAGMITGITFECLKSGFGIVITNFTSYELVYGAFAVLPVFIFWLYLSWCLILLGVEISHAITVFSTNDQAVRHPLLALLDVLHFMHTQQQLGKQSHESDLQHILGRHELINWQTYKTQLSELNLIAETAQGDFVLQHHLDDISFWDLYKALPYPLPHKKDIHLAARNYAQNTSPLMPWQQHLHQRLLQSDHQLQKKLHISLTELFADNPTRH